MFQDDPCFEKTGGKGRELTGQDFIYSFKRIADKRVNSNGWWIFRERVIGLDEFREKTENAKGMALYDEPVEGLSAPDDHTLVIRLKKPYPQLVYILTMSYTCALPREAVEFYGEEFLNHPVGTGPFRLESWVRDSKIVYVRNTNYRGETYPVKGTQEDQNMGLLADAGKPVPFLDKLTLHIMKEPSAMWLQFLAGNLDRSGIPKDNYDGAVDSDKNLKEELTQKGIILWKTPMLDLTYQSFNMEDPILGKSLALRQALSLSLNVEQMIVNLYNNRAIRAKGPIPPDLEGYDPDLDNPYARYDLEEARKKMAEARKYLGLGPDDVIELTYDSQSNDTIARQFDEFVVDCFTQIGIKIKYNVNTWPQFLDRIKNKKGQLFGAAWGADYPDAENFLQLLYGPNESPGDNNSNYKNPEFNKLYEQTSLMEDSTERSKIYKRMVEIVIADCPWIFCTHRLGFSLQHKWLKNYKPHDLAQNTYKYYRIDKGLKKSLKENL
jgi:ABC-type transport system substrate-binding protein